MSAPPVRRPHLLERLPQWAETWRNIGQAPGRAPEAIVRAEASVARVFGNLVPRDPPRYELADTLAAIRQAWDAARSVAGAPRRHLRRSPWVLFYPSPRDQSCVAAEPALLTAWLAWLTAQRRAGIAVATLRELLRHYPTDAPAFEQIRSAVRTRVMIDSSPYLAKWRERCVRYGLLERDGPVQMGTALLETRLGYQAVIEDAGLATGLESAEFLVHAVRGLLARVERELGEDRLGLEGCERVLTIIGDGSNLRFPTLKAEIADALLLPFAEREPTSEIKQLLRTFLTRTIGDPRVHPARWQGVRDPVRQVLLRWLVALSLEAFFSVLDRTALERHWIYRKHFWSAYLSRDLIEEAWLALGPSAQRVVDRRRGAGIAFGELRLSGGADAAHSVLLMKIGNMTIAEWSHSGRCRMWLADNPSAPKLYRSVYKRSEFMRDASWEQSHHGSETGQWQARIASQIQAQAGIRMTRTEYMPPPGTRTRAR